MAPSLAPSVLPTISYNGNDTDEVVEPLVNGVAELVVEGEALVSVERQFV